MTVRELIEKLREHDPDTEVEVKTTVGDRNVTREIWDISLASNKPSVVYIHG